MLHLLLGAALAGPGVPGRAAVVDRVVADVDGHLVLLSDLAREAALASVDPGGTPFWDPDWRTAEERLVDAAVVRTIAANVQLYEPARQDVQRRLEAVRAQFPDRRAWRAFLELLVVDEDRLSVVLRRRMVVDRYLTRKLVVKPTEVEEFKAAALLHLDDLRQATRVRRIPAISETP